MKNLDEILENCSEKILARGEEYYSLHRCEKPEEVRKGFYQLTVSGTNDYTVEIYIVDQQITDYKCDCPYDGEPCKHIIAALFEIEEYLSNPATRSSPEKSFTTREEEVLSLLSGLDKQELQQFVAEYACINIDFYHLLKAKYVDVDAPDLRLVYQIQIEAVIHSAADRSGYVSWERVDQVETVFMEINSVAQRMISEGKYDKAFAIITVILEEVTAAFEICDSSGELGANIDSAMGSLIELVDANPPKEVRDEIINYCKRCFKTNLFDGWDWHIDIFQVIIPFFRTKKIIREMRLFLDGISDQQIDRVKRHEIIYQMILVSESKDDASKYLEDNSWHPPFRRKLIDIRLEAKDFDKAKRLVKEGLEINSEFPGVVFDWYEILLEIALLEKNKTDIVKFARRQLIEGNYRQDHHMDILRAWVPEGDWNHFVDNLVIDLDTGSSYYSDLIPDILRNEDRPEELMSYLTKHPGLWLLSSYDKYLATHCPRQFSSLYSNLIFELLESVNNRKQYKSVCRHILQIFNLGFKDIANELIGAVKISHARRPAMMDELKQVEVLINVN